MGKAADTNTITRVKEKGVTGIMEDIIIEQKNAQQKEENMEERKKMLSSTNTQKLKVFPWKSAETTKLS